MTNEHSSDEATHLPSCFSGNGVLEAMALMAEHKVRAVLVRDEFNVITGVFRLQQGRIEFEPAGS